MLFALGAWGGKHFGDAPVSQLVDVASGAPIDPVVVDRLSGLPLGQIDMRIEVPEV